MEIQRFEFEVEDKNSKGFDLEHRSVWLRKLDDEEEWRKNGPSFRNVIVEKSSASFLETRENERVDKGNHWRVREEKISGDDQEEEDEHVWPLETERWLLRGRSVQKDGE